MPGFDRSEVLRHTALRVCISRMSMMRRIAKASYGEILEWRRRGIVMLLTLTAAHGLVAQAPRPAGVTRRVETQWDFRRSTDSAHAVRPVVLGAVVGAVIGGAALGWGVGAFIRAECESPGCVSRHRAAPYIGAAAGAAVGAALGALVAHFVFPSYSVRL